MCHRADVALVRAKSEYLRVCPQSPNDHRVEIKFPSGDVAHEPWPPPQLDPKYATPHNFCLTSVCFNHVTLFARNYCGSVSYRHIPNYLAICVGLLVY